MNRALYITIVFLCLLPQQMSAQAKSGEIIGHVYDFKRQPVPSTSVKVYFGENLIDSVRTDEHGTFNIKSITAGTYDIIASSPKFGKTMVTGITVDDESTLSIDLKYASKGVASPKRKHWYNKLFKRKENPNYTSFN